MKQTQKKTIIYASQKTLKRDASKEFESSFYSHNVSGLNIEQTVLDDLKESFYKFLPEDTPGDLGDNLDPKYMKTQYESLGLDKENPSMYNMICWITKEY